VAKTACTADTVAEDALGFIMGRRHQPRSSSCSVRKMTPRFLHHRLRSLQDFFEALPQPLLHPVNDKTVAEIYAPGWPNTLTRRAQWKG
jgi:hypothetical protein